MVGRAVATDPVTAGVCWFLRCPDGLIRGPFGVDAIRQWLAHGQIEENAPMFAGRIALRPDPPETEAPKTDPWKSTWRKHLRPHRWRATRATVKLGKSAAQKSVSAVSCVAPIKTWADEEAEWAAMVTRAHAQHRPTKLRTQRPPPRPREPPRPAPRRPRRFRSVDASKQLDPSAAWRDDSRAALVRQLKRAALVAVVVVAAAVVGALLARVLPTPEVARPFVEAAGAFATRLLEKLHAIEVRDVFSRLVVRLPHRRSTSSRAEIRVSPPTYPAETAMPPAEKAGAPTEFSTPGETSR